jgi:hypothetical protein
MKQITAKEFYAMIVENPSVFEHWNTPHKVAQFLKTTFPEILAA